MTIPSWMPDRSVLNEAHAKVRSMERYAAMATDADLADMVCQIREERGVFVRKKTKTVSMWIVWWRSQNRCVPVYYSKKQGTISSVLPKGMVEKRATELFIDDVRAAPKASENVTREAVTA